MVTDYLMLAQSLHQAADSMNAYVAVLASTSTHSDTVSLLIPPPQLPPLAPYNGPGGARIPLPNLHNRAANNHSDSEEEGDNSKKRKSRATKEKKPKDPNAPKRPASGYLVYQNDVRAQVKAANPNMPHKDVQAKIAADWATLDADEKKVRLPVSLTWPWLILYRLTTTKLLLLWPTGRTGLPNTQRRRVMSLSRPSQSQLLKLQRSALFSQTKGCY